MRVEDIVRFDTFITGVSFGDDSIEITFLEKREQAENIMMARTMAIYLDDQDEDSTKMDIYADIQDKLRMLVEIGYVELRNPPDEFVEEPSKNWVHSKMVEGQ
jgi:hypothetical protein